MDFVVHQVAFGPFDQFRLKIRPVQLGKVRNEYCYGCDTYILSVPIVAICCGKRMLQKEWLKAVCFYRLESSSLISISVIFWQSFRNGLLETYQCWPRIEELENERKIRQTLCAALSHSFCNIILHFKSNRGQSQSIVVRIESFS